MKSILNNSGNRIELNALFLQPTRWCGLNCKGCYVKEHEGGENGYHTPWREQVKLLEYFIDPSYKEYHANQITISIDDLPHNYYEPEFGNERADHMIKLFRDALCLSMDSKTTIGHLDPDNSYNAPALHMTFNSTKTYIEYMDEITIVNSSKIHRSLDMISFSNIKDTDLDIIKLLASHTHINYNHLIPSNVTSFNIDK